MVRYVYMYRLHPHQMYAINGPINEDYIRECSNFRRANKYIELYFLYLEVDYESLPEYF